ncbi:MAG: PEP-CTERM sorting domain-containing protein, partial [Planctomycetota bacterium]
IDADLLRQHVTGLAVYYVGDYNTDTARTISLDSIELVPEPGTMGLLAIGGVGALIRRRRRN